MTTAIPLELQRLLVPPPGEIQLQDSGGAARLWAVLRPVDLTLSHGIHITEERLQELADSYDPEGIEVAPINFDHDYGGPAHGWIRSLSVQGGLLLAEPMDLSQELIQGLQDHRYRRQSVEINLEHQVTGGWYLEGLAVLGNAKPAVKALPSITLTSRPRWVLAPRKETTLSQPILSQPDLRDPTETQDLPSSPEPAGTPPSLPDPPETDRVTLADERQRLRDETEAARRERLAARRERLQGEAERLLGDLGSRITPGMRRAGLEELLVTLRAPDKPLRVELAAEQGESQSRDASEVLLAVLAAIPEFTALGKGALADGDGGAPLARDHRDADQRALDSRNGITDERALELQRKYPNAFAAN